MSFMIDFPNKFNLPENIRSPPFVIFAIQNRDVEAYEFPPHMPLAMVLHFAPKLASCVVPPPTELPPAARDETLLRSYVGINIQEDIDAGALFFIVSRMLHIAGFTPKKEVFHIMPNILESVKVVEAWRVLDLPAPGLQGIEIHILTQMMIGPKPGLNEVIALFNTFPTTSQIMYHMGANFTRAYANFDYSLLEGSQITEWIAEDPARQKFFSQFESEFKEPAGKETVVATPGLGVPPPYKKDATATRPVSRRAGSDILEATGTRHVSYQERREREQNDAQEMRRRLRRLRSDENIRTVNPGAYDLLSDPPTENVRSNVGDEKMELISKPKEVTDQVGVVPNRFSTAVNASLLTLALENVKKEVDHSSTEE